ncbi:hypothetical protein GYMLUDRAFT_39002 [Collybiopsis luxurians FD-317 M1]|nr:hypothetical protein GYMLUDRAFT_39002 [Collybiopsis luxurians FD-317 M1]
MFRIARPRPTILSRRLSTSASITDPTAYCLDLVKNHDYESYLIAQFWPKELRGGYFALKAFSTELAMIQDNVSTSTIGMMRIQFWRDAVKAITEGNPPRHPIALALHQEPSIQQAGLQMYHFKRIIDARDAELQVPVHLTVDSLTAHAESTSSTILYLLLSLQQSLLPSPSKVGAVDLLSHALSHLGTAQTITTLLRALPYHARNGRMVIPAEITAKHNVVQEEVFRIGPGAKGLDDAVFEFATIANDHLRTAQEMFEDGNNHDHSHGHSQEGLGNSEKNISFGGRIPQEAMPVFLTGVPVSAILNQLEKVNFNVFDSRVQRRDWKLPWRIWKGWYKRRMY